jgi:hypothetical protein
MLKKTITYVDFDDNERTETFYFNLSKAELAEMELSLDGGFAQKINKIVEAKDSKELISIFKGIILKSYGEKSLDGRFFVKNQRVRDDFLSSPAYNYLFMELATNTESATAFINGIMPKMN